MTTTIARRAAGRPALLVRPLRQAPRLDPCKRSRTRPSAARTAPSSARRKLKRASTAPARCSAFPPTTASASSPPPTPARWRWRMWSMLGARPVDCSPGRSSARTGSPTSSSSSSSKDVTRAQGRLRRAPRPRRKSTPGPGHRLHLERHHLRRARSERRLDRRRPRRPHHLRRHLGGLRAAISPGTSSMSSPSPGRRCWAARRRTAC